MAQPKKPWHLTWSVLLLSLCLGLLSLPALAVLPDEVLPDQTMERRARAISAELRCLVCQNESIDGSHAPFARDLRLLVRQLITEGADDRQVLAFIQARYGEYILLKPGFNPRTALLWLAPIAILFMGVIAIVIALRRRQNQDIPPLSQEEQARFEKLWAEDSQNRPNNQE